MMGKNLRAALLSLFVVFSGFMMSGKDFVVVIDAGHGGHDYGAIGAITNEKTINLGVALKLGNLIKKAHKDVKVIYTRDGDYFKELQERANIANKANADLFISIHTNSVDKKNPNRTRINGAATYTLGLHKSAANLAVAKRENSVIMLENDYSERYSGFDPNSTESYIIFELSQNKHLDQSIDFAGKVQKEMTRVAGRKNNGVRQAGFLVLARTSMPAVLIELDFICNPDAERFLGSTDGQNKFAKAIFTAFNSYKVAYDHASGKPGAVAPAVVDEPNDECDDSANKPAEVKPDKPSKAKPNKPVEAKPDKVAESKSDIVYKIQFLTADRLLKAGATEFKGLKDVDSYKDGGVYKYTVGSYDSRNAAQAELRKIRKIHSGAFIIETRDGVRIK